MRAVAETVAEARGVGEAGHVDGPALDALLRGGGGGEQQMLHRAGGGPEAEAQRVGEGEPHQ
jgi:hypothetical protein